MKKSSTLSPAPGASNSTPLAQALTPTFMTTPNGSKVRVFVIDPKKLPSITTNTNVNANKPIAPNPTPSPSPQQLEIKRSTSSIIASVLQSRAVKSSESASQPIIDKKVVEDEDDDEERQLLLKGSSITRAGRITKPTITSKEASPNSTNHNFTIPQVPRVRKRDPPEIFRCITCNKVYLGYVKLRKHFRQYPEHQGSSKFINSPNGPSKPQVPTVRKTSIGIQAEVPALEPAPTVPGPAASFAEPSVPETSPTRISFIQEEPSDSVTESGASITPNSLSLPRHTEPIQATPVTTISSSSSTQTQINQETQDLLDNLTENISMPPLTPTTMDLTEILHGAGAASAKAKQEETLASTSNCSGPVVPAPFWNGIFNFPSTSSTSAASTSINTNTSNSEGRGQDSTSPTGTGGHGRGFSVPGNSGSNSKEDSSHRTLWDTVEDKLLNGGVNHMISELVDVADKLGKIARDKIIPIREDEEERLINSSASVPIIRVDTPFLSHLLDLPFGTYMFREDGGIHRAPMPPPPELSMSLTAGEVDIDKFLMSSRDDLTENSLPSLSNLDIASICNN